MGFGVIPPLPLGIVIDRGGGAQLLRVALCLKRGKNYFEKILYFGKMNFGADSQPFGVQPVQLEDHNVCGRLVAMVILNHFDLKHFYTCDDRKASESKS